MWDTPFEPAMLDLSNGVVIHCPEEGLAYELFEIIKEYRGTPGNWHNTSATHWSAYKQDTAYFFRNDTLMYGPTIHAENEDMSYSRYTKCTFYGSAPDFDTATDDEIRSLFSA